MMLSKYPPGALCVVRRSVRVLDNGDTRLSEGDLLVVIKTQASAHSILGLCAVKLIRCSTGVLFDVTMSSTELLKTLDPIT